MNYFPEEEQRCPCCGLIKTQPKFLAALNTVREMCGFPLVATSMTRCEKHNKEVGGSKHSDHLNGDAADIACTDMLKRGQIAAHAWVAGIKKIEISSVHIHLSKTEGDLLLMLKLPDGRIV